MLERLTARLQASLGRLRGRGRLTENDVDEALREVRLALLEADVHYRTVKDFIGRVREKAVGEEVLKSLSPDQHVVKIVHDELIELLGGEDPQLNLSPKPPTVILLVGLQGTGKTTTAGKLALYLSKQNHRPLLVATDIHRPAAIEQLVTVGQSVDVPVFEVGRDMAPPRIAKAALSHARSHDRDCVIIDTAGRLHVDEEMMEEIRQVSRAVSPHETLMVLDAMTGQDAVNSAQEFDAAVGVTGFVLTKLDGDARGGAVLSVRAVTGKPIKFVGIGEKVDALEVFHPDRMASRILGMGDVLTLIEKAEEVISEEEAAEMERKLLQDEFTLQDLYEQLQQMKKMGPLDQLLGMIPGMQRMGPVQIDEKALARNEAIILSMTPEERRRPEILSGSRKRRIARGSGTTPHQVNQLLNQFKAMKRMVKQMSKANRGGKKNMKQMPKMMGM